jgi:hypothetical protein
MNQYEENALRIYNAKLEKENERLRLLSSPKGFYTAYFKELITAKSNKAAFDTVNEEYYKLFESYRYSDWNSFKKMTNYYNNKNKSK